MESVDVLADYFGGPLILFLLVLTRLGVMLLAMPAIGSGVPMRVRAFLAIALALLLMPLITPHASPPIDSLLELTIAAAREAGIGMLIGLVIRLLVTGLQLAGEVASNSGGMQLGDSQDPEMRATVPTLARLIGLMVTAVMLTAGGHRMMIEALMDSFVAMPPGDVRFDVGMLELVVYELSSGMSAGIRASAPIVAAMLLTNLITGLISRTLPQLNVLAIGLNINALALMFVSTAAIASAGWIFRDELELAFERLQQLW